MTFCRFTLFFCLSVPLLLAQPGFAQNKRSASKTGEDVPGIASEFLGVEEVIAVDPGRVREIKVRPGDIVKQGTLLGSLDYHKQWFSLETAKIRAGDRSKIKEMEAEVSLKSSVLDDHRERFRRRQVNEHAVTQSEASLKVSMAKLEAAKADQALKELAMEEAQRAYDDRFFFAPINGVVLSVEHKKNDNIGAGTVVFRIGDNSSWVLRQAVSPETAASLFVGRTIPLFTAGSDIARLGRITNIIRQDDGQHIVEFTVPNSMASSQTAPPQFEEPEIPAAETPAPRSR